LAFFFGCIRLMSTFFASCRQTATAVFGAAFSLSLPQLHHFSFRIKRTKSKLQIAPPDEASANLWTALDKLKSLAAAQKLVSQFQSGGHVGTCQISLRPGGF